MHKTAIIPARYSSTRLPAKPLKLIEGKSLIQRVYEAVAETNLFDRIIIATDHEEIYNHALPFRAETMMTSPTHQSGTDRIEECARQIKTDLIVNVQGDEPFITKEPLEKLLNSFGDIAIASLMHILEDVDDIKNPNFVKVVTDKDSNAIYFSRSPIPFNRDNVSEVVYYKHIGVYAFRPEALTAFVELPQGILEQVERLEQLRFLENGYKIKMVLTNYTGIGIDTHEDLKKAEVIYQSVWKSMK